MLALKRVYDPARPSDGYRILVDRLWPRGVSRERAKIDLWLKDLGPSDALRKWFGHDPARWTEFERRYRRELRAKSDLIRQIKQIEKKERRVTLIYSARDEEHNQAVALGAFLRSRR